MVEWLKDIDCDSQNTGYNWQKHPQGEWLKNTGYDWQENIGYDLQEHPWGSG